MGSRPPREVARIVLIDANGTVLLVRYDDGRTARPKSYWATPGGALEQGETHRTAAARELREETGLDAEIGRELWQRSFSADLGQGPMDQVECYFLARVAGVSPSVANSSPEAIREHRWWPLAELAATREVIFPEGLAASLTIITAASSGDAA